MNTKTISKAIKAVVPKNAILPICESIKFTGSEAVVTDLEVSLSIPYVTEHIFVAHHQNIIDMWETFTEGFTASMDGDTLCFTHGKAKIKITTDNYEDFPMVGDIGDDPGNVTLLNSDVAMLKIANDFIGKDELHQQFMYICLKNGKMYATDAHALVAMPVVSEIGDSQLFISKKVRTLLELWEGDWTVAIGQTNTSFTHANGVIITTRNFDERYPDVEAVIPKDNPIELKVIVKEFMDTIKTGSKFNNKSTNAVLVECKEGNTTLSFSDVDLGKSYDKTLELQSVNGDIEIGFNTKIIEKVFKHCGNKATMRMSLPTRAAIVNDVFLIMPVMITKPSVEQEEQEQDEEQYEEETQEQEQEN